MLKKKTIKKRPRVKQRVINPLNAKPLADRELPINAVIYGRSGTGKTTFASSFPKPLLLIDIRDRGTDSIANAKNTDYIDLQNVQQLEDIVEHLRLAEHKYKSVVIDTVTQLQQMMIEELLAEKKKDTKEAGKWGSMTLKDWGTISSNMRFLLSRFKDLPIHTCFIAQEKVSSTDEMEDIEGR